MPILNFAQLASLARTPEKKSASGEKFSKARSIGRPGRMPFDGSKVSSAITRIKSAGFCLGFCACWKQSEGMQL
jgi:hypothetical protein